MKLLRDSAIEKIRQEGKEAFLKNISTNIPKKADVISAMIKEQLERTTRTISEWRSLVESAEDIDNPDREELMEYYKDFVDDYQLFAVMQSRINKSISGAFHIYKENGEIDKEETAKFMGPQGYPHMWFRNFMKIVMLSEFYGFEAIQLGNIIDNRFDKVEKIPEENLIPYYDAMILDVNIGWVPGTNTIFFNEDPYNNWIVRVGSKTDLGLINKCAPYIIYKSVFGNWSQHASVFGMPLRVAKTDLTDNTRRQNLIDFLENSVGASYMIADLLDELQVIEQKGGGDPHNIYGEFINKCDAAISKIVLSQTGTTDEKAYSGSAIVHAMTEDDLIFSDKLNIMAVINDELIPRMKKIGMISKDKKIYGGWDFSEDYSAKEWAEIIQKLSQSGFAIPASEVTRLTGIEVDETVVAMPDNKTISIMNKIDKLYGKDNK